MLVNENDFLTFLEKCYEEGLGNFDQVIVPKKLNPAGSDLHFVNLSAEGQLDLNQYRTVEPARSLFYFTREQVIPFNHTDQKRLIVGIKACDLKALAVLDKALINDDFVDPAYRHWRKNTSIISSDCDAICPTCHCTLLDGKPYAEQGFDLNISKVEDQYHLTAQTSKGEDLLKLIKKTISHSETSDHIKEKIDRKRNNVIEQLKKQNKQFQHDKAYDNLRKTDLAIWQEESQTCVGCGGCTNICPTCYCLILNDETTGEEFVKVRSTDSCQMHGYARVAGGASPRPKMYDRFRNRYLCKFDYMKHDFDLLGCVGCGRCTEVCPGEIEFREVVQRTVNPSVKQAQES